MVKLISRLINVTLTTLIKGSGSSPVNSKLRSSPHLNDAPALLAELQVQCTDLDQTLSDLNRDLFSSLLAYTSVSDQAHAFLDLIFIRLIFKEVLVMKCDWSFFVLKQLDYLIGEKAWVVDWRRFCLRSNVSGAAAGVSLADVGAEARRASEMVGTMGFSLSVCTLPGQVTPDRLGPGKMELGLGIHGEPGAAVADLQPVDVIVSHVLKQILCQENNYVPITCGSRVVLMVNGLGATPAMELMIANGKTVPKLQLEHGLTVARVYTGSFTTSLDMAGCRQPYFILWRALACQAEL